MDLDVNESKTEFVCLFLAFPCEVEDNGDNKPCPGGPVKLLLLCSQADIKHRIVLANSAFQTKTFSKVWS